MRSDYPRIFNNVDNSTNRETRDQQEERRDKKRQRRVDDGDVGVPKDPSFDSLPVSQGNVPSGFQRDEDYYVGPLEVDEHVVCLRDTLYKVKTAALDRCPTLKDLVFRGKEHPPEVERWTDENPLRIYQHVAPDALKALLWFIHKSTDELSVLPQSYDDVEMILSLATAARPFGLEDVHTWSLGVVHRAVEDDAFMKSCGSSTLAKLIEVAHFCHKPGLVPSITSKWHSRLLNKMAPAVPAMHAAERFGLKDLKGVAYYSYLMDMAEGQEAGSDGAFAPLRVNDKVNSAQTMRLLAGYMSLTKFWEKFRAKPLDLPLGPECSEQEHTGCIAAWGKRWTSVVGWKRTLACSSADVLACMKTLADQLSNDENFGNDALKPCCKAVGLKAIRLKSQEVEENIGSHFTGCC